MNNENRVTSSKPESITNIFMLLLGPLVVTLTLIIISHIYMVKFDGAYISLMVITFLVSFIVFKEINLHTSWRSGGVSAQTREVVFAWLVFVSILLFLGYATRSSEEFSRRVILTWMLVSPFILLTSYTIAKSVLFGLIRSKRFSRSVVVVGVNDLSKSLVSEISSDPQLNMSFEGYFDDRSIDRLGGNKSGVEEDKLLGKFNELTEYINQKKVELIYFALPMVQEKRILNLLDGLRDTTASIYFVPDLFIFDLIQARVDDVNGIPVLAVCESPFAGVTGLLKRLSDILLASICLILVSPLMLMIAISIKLFMKGGPVLFKQKRYGLDGEEIKVYKFRTMTTTDNGDTVVQATRNDARITPLGAFLRKTSMDELPQFYNVLQGRMSVVGPRPHAVAHNEEYRKLIKGYMMRHKVRPGITGWAQVNGLRGETDTIEKMESRIQYDLDYLRHWSLGLDSMIILRTILMMFRDKNAF